MLLNLQNLKTNYRYLPFWAAQTARQYVPSSREPHPTWWYCTAWGRGRLDTLSATFPQSCTWSSCLLKYSPRNGSCSRPEVNKYGLKYGLIVQYFLLQQIYMLSDWTKLKANKIHKHFSKPYHFVSFTWRFKSLNDIRDLSIPYTSRLIWLNAL